MTTKKIFLPIMVLFLMLGCSDDDSSSDTGDNENPDVENTDDDGAGDTGEGILKILSVDAISDEVTLTNLGDGTLDIGDYFLCLGPGTYLQISGATSESTSLEPDDTLVLSYDMNPTADGLSIFATNSFTSSDPSILLDYVQWGAGDQPRVDQAVTAGRWDDTSNFVPEGSPYNYTGDSDDIGVTFWE